MSRADSEGNLRSVQDGTVYEGVLMDHTAHAGELHCPSSITMQCIIPRPLPIECAGSEHSRRLAKELALQR